MAMSASETFNSLREAIDDPLATNPNSHDLGERITQLFKDHGLKPKKTGIRKIIKDYVKRTGN